MSKTAAPNPKLSLRITFPGGMMFGPGKADLLENIDRLGSISAAGRAMGMSYKRAWMLVEALNQGFVAPLVESARGGTGGGGAQLTETGKAVLSHYRTLMRDLARDQNAELAQLSTLLASPAVKDRSAAD